MLPRWWPLGQKARNNLILKIGKLSIAFATSNFQDLFVNKFELKQVV